MTTLFDAYKSVTPPYGSEPNEDMKPHLLTTSYKVIYMQETMFNALSRTNGFMLKNSYEYLSYDDIAFFIELNRLYGSGIFKDIPRNPTSVEVSNLSNEYLDTLPEDYKRNVNFILSTQANTLTVIGYMNDEVEDSPPYKITVINTDVVVIVKPGLYRLLKDKERKIEFLKELSSMCFNVMGDSNTHAQPFFRELVSIL